MTATEFHLTPTGRDAAAAKPSSLYWVETYRAVGTSGTRVYHYFRFVWRTAGGESAPSLTSQVETPTQALLLLAPSLSLCGWLPASCQRGLWKRFDLGASQHLKRKIPQT